MESIERKYSVIKARYLGQSSLNRGALRDLQLFKKSLDDQSRLSFRERLSKLSRRFKNWKLRYREDIKSVVEREVSKEWFSRCEAAREAYTTASNAAQHDCLALSLSIAKEIILKEINNPEVIATRINAAISQLVQLRATRLVVNSKDLEALKEQQAEIFSSSLQIETDDSIKHGEFRLESGSASVSFDWEKQLSDIAELLRSEIEKD